MPPTITSVGTSNSTNFSLGQLKAATLAGGVVVITLRGDGAAFVVHVQTQRGPTAVWL